MDKSHISYKSDNANNKKKGTVNLEKKRKAKGEKKNYNNHQDNNYNSKDRRKRDVEEGKAKRRKKRTLKGLVWWANPRTWIKVFL